MNKRAGLISLMAFAGVVGGVIAWRSTRQRSVDGYWAVPAASIPGAPTGVAPIALTQVAADRVRARPNVTEPPELTSIHMNGVAPNGLMDLVRCEGNIEYQFRAKTPSGVWGATAMVVRDGMYTPILSEHAAKPLPRPSCSLERVWAAARAAGAKDDACAAITYGNRPREDFVAQGWSFRGGGIAVAIDDATCTVVPSPSDVVTKLERELGDLGDELARNAGARPRTPALEEERTKLEAQRITVRTRLTVARERQLDSLRGSRP